MEKITDKDNIDKKLEAIELVNSKEVNFSKFSQSQWNKVEKKYNNPLTYAVLDAMCKLGGEYEYIPRTEAILEKHYLTLGGVMLPKEWEDKKR